MLGSHRTEKAKLECNVPKKMINEYTRYLQAEKGAAPATRLGYQRAVTSFLALCRSRPEALFLPPDWSYADIDKRSVEVYLNYLRQDRGWRPVSIARQVTALRSFFGFLQRQGHVPRNPLRSIQPAVPSQEPTPALGEESAVLHIFDVPAETFNLKRLLAVMELAYGLAMRPSQIYRVEKVELIARRSLAQITMDGEILEAPVTEGGIVRLRAYTKHRERILRKRPGSEPAAPFWIDEQGHEVKPPRLARAASAAMEAAGLPGGLRKLRQLAARHFRERGGDIRSLQTLLRAKRLGSLDRYDPPDVRKVIAMFRQAHPRERKK